jgi:hypothetical protein
MLYVRGFESFERSDTRQSGGLASMIRQPICQQAVVASRSLANVWGLLKLRSDPRRAMVTSRVHFPEPRTWNVRAVRVKPLYRRG